MVVGLAYLGLKSVTGRGRLRKEGLAWHNLALSLQIDPPSSNKPTYMTGMYKERELTITPIKFRESTIVDFPLNLFVQQPTGTRVYLSSNEPIEGVRLSLVTDGFHKWADKLAGIREVEIGDREFDKRFFIRSSPEELAEEVLSSALLRRRILKAKDSEFIFDGDDLVWTASGLLMDVKYMHSVVDVLYDLMDEIERQAHES